MKRSKSFLDRHLNAVAILVLLAVSSFLGVFVLPAFAGSVVAAQAIGCSSCSTMSLTFTNVFSNDTMIAAATVGPGGGYPTFTSNQGESSNVQATYGDSDTDGSYQFRIMSFRAAHSGTYVVSTSWIGGATKSLFAVYHLRGFSPTLTSSSHHFNVGHETTDTLASIPSGAFIIAVTATTQSSGQSWSIGGASGPGVILNGDTNTRVGTSGYVVGAAAGSFAWDFQGTAGSIAFILDASFPARSFVNPTLDVNILNMDLGNYLVVPYNKFYNFNETAIGVHGSNVNIVKWKWTDGLSTAEVQYSNVTKVATVLQGNNIITIGAPTATSSIVGGQKRLQVIIPVRPSENILDTVGVSINAYSQLADGTTTGYLVVRAKYFNIFNQGGTASSQISGLCAPSPILSGYFSALCQDPGWLMTNTTWFQLQSYHTEFAINLNDASGVPDVFLFQDFGNSNGGAEHYTAKGDWKVDVGWFYFNNGAWTKAFHVTLQMFKGNQGVQDQWTLVNALFYNGKNTLISNQTFNAWIEQSPRSQIRLYVDLWISKLNGSSLHAMRVGAYYYAIHQSGFTFFGTWSPFLQNASSAMAFAKNIDAGGKNIPAGQISFEKLYWNISRSHHPIGQANFQLFTRDYNLEQFKTTKGPMAGVDTPIFVDAKIPTLPVDGFFAPLYAAIASIGDFIWGALAAAFSAIWVAIGSRFPWFTGFWDTIGGNVTNFATLFISVLGYLGGFLSFLVSIFTFVTTPIQIVINAWNFLSSAFNTVLPGASAGQFATIFIIFTFGISLLEALFTGDWPWIIKFARQTWAIVNAIMFYAFKFARILIDAVLAIIP